jgi:CHASE3 domain sensor protein
MLRRCVTSDIKSRSDAEWVNHTLEVLNKITDQRLRIRRAESAARGFVLTSDPSFREEYNDSTDSIASAFTDLIDSTRDNPNQSRSLESLIPLVASRLAVTGELIRRHAAGDVTGVAALTTRAEGRTLMRSLQVAFDQLVAEEQRLLIIRNAEAQHTSRTLLTIDLSGAALILILAAISMRNFRRSTLRLETSLHTTETANEVLEAAVAERTAHLKAIHGKLEHSSSILAGTFASMAEAVLVVDTGRTVLLSNRAAERLLNARPGMAINRLTAHDSALQADDSTPLSARDKPTARALRGEEFRWGGNNRPPSRQP